MTSPDPKADAVRAAANAAGAVDDDAVVALVNQATERDAARAAQ